MTTLLTEQDHQLINNDATIYVLQDGRPHAVTPFRIAATLQVRKDTQNVQCGFTNGISPLATSRQMPTSVPLPSVPNGMPISMQAHMKGMQPPATIPHMRISSGNSRPPATSNLAPVLLSSIVPSAVKCGLFTHSHVQRVAYPPLVYGRRCRECVVYTEWCTCRQWTDL